MYTLQGKSTCQLTYKQVFYNKLHVVNLVNTYERSIASFKQNSRIITILNVCNIYELVSASEEQDIDIERLYFNETHKFIT